MPQEVNTKHARDFTDFKHVYVPATRERFIHHNQKDVGLLGLSTSLKLEGVVLKHIVDVKLCCHRRIIRALHVGLGEGQLNALQV